MGVRANSSVSFAKATLPYPLFAADFDPYNRGYLVVGGGGGESKTGVPNRISVLDVSDRKTITTVVEADLSRDEDSVQSLASLASKDGLITFAGINSSQAQQNAGKNEHLRSFDVKYPPRKKQRTEKVDVDEDGSIAPIGKRSLFTPSTTAKKETYQRLLRLSPAQKRASGSRRIGAVATGMARDNEIVVFDATSAAPDAQDIITRIRLPRGSEAADLDLGEPEQSRFSLTYCTDHDVYEQTFQYNFATKKAERTPNGPRRIHQMPFPDASEAPNSRPKFRCVRFLNTENIIALSNKPNKGGAELTILHLYPTGPAALQMQKSLPSRMRQAVSMDVCALDVDKSGDQQIAVAVAGQDISIEVYVTNYSRRTATFSPFRHYITLRNVHEHQMTKLCFTPFHSPARAADPDAAPAAANGAADDDDALTTKAPVSAGKAPAHPGPQYIRLASVTYGNTVVVDTFPLAPLEPQDKDTRYVLSHPSDESFTTFSYIAVITGIVLVFAFMVQSFLTGFADAEGGSAGGVSPFNVLPQGVREFLDMPARAASGVKMTRVVSHVVAESLPQEFPGKRRLSDLLASFDASSSKALVVRDEGERGVAVDEHADREAYLSGDRGAKGWEQLSAEQQRVWRERLVRAGELVEGQGGSVLKGVVFSELGGLWGGVAAQALAG
ncbi:hypothetical protein LTR08_005978 [Meristemomyces frigidus]|nr:hypothetical protein LTR08_005978 [Meristemomyces frigidus]